MASIKRNQTKYDEALNYYKETIDLYKKLPENLQWKIFEAHIGIGSIMFNSGNYNESMEQFRNSAEDL